MEWVYPLEFSGCREFRHAWEIEAWERGWRRVVLCWNCKTRRVDTFDSHGRVDSRRYIYPKGYHLKKMPGAVLELRRQLERDATKLDRWVGIRKQYRPLIQKLLTKKETKEAKARIGKTVLA